MGVPIDVVAASIAGAAAAENGGVARPGTAAAITAAVAGQPPAPAPELPTTYNNMTLNPNAGTRFGRNEFGAGKLTLYTFPKKVEEGGIPYIFIKIFETQEGQVPQTSETSFSVANGSQTFFSAAQGFPGGTTALATAAAGSVFGPTGAVIAGAATATGTGDNILNSVGAAVLGTAESGDLSFVSLAKNNIKNFNLKRNIDQLETAIALFMPDGLTSNYDNEYEALSVTATLGAAGFAAQALNSKSGVLAINPYIAEASAAFAAKLIGNEDVTKLGLFGATGLVRNPQLEMIYNSPVLRKFVFDFRMIPRNQSESELIKSIVTELKRYSAPRRVDGTGGRFLIPPAQFELEFYNGDHTLNTYLFKTKKCVLSSISIDYTPNGFATFKDGAPVETRMQLTFQETEIIDRTAVEAGY